MLRLDLIVMAAFLAGCGGASAMDDDGAVDRSDDFADADDLLPVDSAPGCTLEPEIVRASLEAESITYLRSAFETTVGFAGGTVAYREGWVSLDDACVFADWTALVYVAPIDPALVPLELRTSHTHVAAVWSTNGRKLIVYITAPSAAEPAPWIEGRLPDNVNAVANDVANGPAVEALVLQLRSDHPGLDIDWLEGIGVLTISGRVGDFSSDEPISATAVEVERAAVTVRASGQFQSIEWSGLSFRLPNEFWPGVAMADQRLRPECERIRTSELRPGFTTSPSLAPPLGNGIVLKTPTCPD
jgi:hypothetical protein